VVGRHEDLLKEPYVTLLGQKVTECLANSRTQDALPELGNTLSL